MKLFPVLLCGGSGTRLWPMSRAALPKQFLPLLGEQTMLQETVNRLVGLTGMDSVIAVANESHRFLVAEQLASAKGSANLAKTTILLEPVARNTAPAIAAAAFEVLAKDPDGLMLVLPADHAIQNPMAFRQAIDAAIPAAANEKIVTFGVVPLGPETGYGYIQAGAAMGQEGLHLVKAFREKPTPVAAQAMLDAGGHYWNAGIFLFSAKTILESIQKFEPEMYRAVERAVKSAKRDSDFVRLDVEAFAAAPSNSIDYAVMERSSDVVVCPVDCGWNDVGSWGSLADLKEKDGAGNSTSAGTVVVNSSNNLVMSSRQVAVLGVDDLIIVDTDDALLVAHREQAQEIKQVVEQLKARGSATLEVGSKVLRPWGAYESVDESTRFQVKRITVKPGAALSLQMHHHRAEHWIVVTGTARITKGDEVFVLYENQSTYIPIGIKHRLENPGKIPLELIEVQSGSYLGEDDIVRFDDVYGR